VIKAGSLRSRPDSCAVTPSDPSFPYRTRLGILATRLGSRAFRAPAAEKCSIASPCYCARAVTRDSHPRRSPAQSRLSNGRSSQSLLPAPSPPTTTQAQTLTLSRVQSTNLGLLFPNARGGLGAALSAGGSTLLSRVRRSPTASIGHCGMSVGTPRCSTAIRHAGGIRWAVRSARCRAASSRATSPTNNGACRSNSSAAPCAPQRIQRDTNTTCQLTATTPTTGYTRGRRAGNTAHGVW
jgi:hypothetical protein